METEQLNYKQVIIEYLDKINSFNYINQSLKGSYTDGKFTLYTEEDYVNLKFYARIYYKPKYIDEILLDYSWSIEKNEYYKMEIDKFIYLWYKSIFEDLIMYSLLFKTDTERQQYSIQDILNKKYKEFGIIDKALK